MNLTGIQRTLNKIEQQVIETRLAGLCRQMSDAELEAVAGWDGERPLPVWFDPDRAAALLGIVRRLYAVT